MKCKVTDNAKLLFELTHPRYVSFEKIHLSYRDRNFNKNDLKFIEIVNRTECLIKAIKIYLFQYKDYFCPY